jgi:cysteinyl-tRNA synthetase
LYRALHDAVAPAGGAVASAAAGAAAGAGVTRAVPAGADEEALGRFHAALDDDFNTPDAMAVVQGVARQLNGAKAAGDGTRARSLAELLRQMGAVLGLLQQDPAAYLKRGKPASSDGVSLSDADIEALIEARRAARAARNFGESDRIRDRLAAAGIVLEDKPGGLSEWRRA